MENDFGYRMKKAWNAFMNRDIRYDQYVNGSYSRPDRIRLTRGNERTIVTAVINKIALDVASIDLYHCRLDEENRFKDIIYSKLNDCLSIEANLDQSHRAFMQDIVMTMLDEGCVAIVPVDTTTNPNESESFEILTIRVGRIVNWFPNTVKVSLYNEKRGIREEIIVPKRKVAIVENPLYAVMNEHNSTLHRLTRKLALLDSIDEQSGSGKLDLIIQLPYTVKSEARREQARIRRDEIENQLKGSKFGIAYTDSTEKITQLNRPLENNLMKQIEYLTSMLYSQLGISQEVLDGTADEKIMNNYFTRTIEPIINSIVDEMNRKFISKTARTQKQKILYFRDPFKLIPISQIADIADKFTRNEILSSNEIRQIVGRRPSNDPRADELLNSNMPHPEENGMEQVPVDETGQPNQETQPEEINLDI